MSTLEKIAFFQDRRDEVPNQLLAKELAESKNKEGILEVVENLKNKNKNIRSDCLKVLYEIGYLDPSLIAGHVEAFMKLLKSKDNRMVWGAMIALATITDLKPKEIWIQIDDVIRITETGTVITQVWGMRTLAKVAAADQAYEKRIFPFLLKQLQICIPRDVPTRAESVLCAVNKGNKKKMLDALEKRRGEMTAAQLTRFKKVLKQLDAI
jgi:HEAT repeat protein